MDMYRIPGLCWDLIISYIEDGDDLVKLLSLDPDFFLENIQLSKLEVPSCTLQDAIQHTNWSFLKIVDRILENEVHQFKTHTLKTVGFYCSRFAAKHETTELLEWLKKHDMLDPGHAACFCNPDTFSWLVHNFPADTAILNQGAWGLARGGHVECLRNLLTNADVPRCATVEEVDEWKFQLFVMSYCESYSPPMFDFVKEWYGVPDKHRQTLAGYIDHCELAEKENVIQVLEWFEQNVIDYQKLDFYRDVLVMGFKSLSCKMVDWVRAKCPPITTYEVSQEERAKAFAYSCDFFWEMDARFNLQLQDIEDLFMGTILEDYLYAFKEQNLSDLYKACQKKFALQIPGKWWRNLFVEVVRYNLSDLAKWIYHDICCPDVKASFACLFRELNSDLLQWLVSHMHFDRRKIVRDMSIMPLNNLSYIVQVYNVTREECVACFTTYASHQYVSLDRLKKLYELLKLRRCDIQHINCDHPVPKVREWLTAIKTGNKRQLDDE